MLGSPEQKGLEAEHVHKKLLHFKRQEVTGEGGHTGFER